MGSLAEHLPDDTINGILTFLEPLDASTEDITALQEPSDSRAARALIAMWLLGRSVGQLDLFATLNDGQEWFLGAPVAPLSGALDEATLATLRLIRFDSTLAELLPYVLDPFGPGTRRAVLKDSDALSDRRARKTTGVFYTPGDVAWFIAQRTLRKLQSPRVVLDPACGTGVFLRAAVAHLVAAGTPEDDAFTALYGIDISVAAIESCAFVLTHDWMALTGRSDARSIWQAVRLNLAAADSLSLSALTVQPTQAPLSRASQRIELRTRLLKGNSVQAIKQEASEKPESSMTLGSLFPEARAADVLIGNPPYAQLGSRDDLSQLGRRFACFATGATASSNSFVPFTEFMWALTTPTGQAGLVVPLSIAYGRTRALSALRAAIGEAGGRWWFSFFDRTPDALFGDDVKQRIAIVIREGADQLELHTSRLTRWTSRQRSELFSRLGHAAISSHDIATGIPKLRDDWEARLYDSVQRPKDGMRGASRLANSIVDSADLVHISATAYNWLATSRGVEPGQSGTDIQAKNAAAADALFAVVSSRLAYWLWRVNGDGFHVSRHFLDMLVRSFGSQWIERDADLATLGRELWAECQQNPIESVNKGRRTVSLTPIPSSETLTKIDERLLMRLGIENGVALNLRDYVMETIIVDNTDPRRNQVTPFPDGLAS